MSFNEVGEKINEYSFTQVRYRRDPLRTDRWSKQGHGQVTTSTVERTAKTKRQLGSGSRFHLPDGVISSETDGDVHGVGTAFLSRLGLKLVSGFNNWNVANGQFYLTKQDTIPSGSRPLSGMTNSNNQKCNSVMIRKRN